jgi:glycosyltransferase involved in cell wall biosynthesis
MPTVSVIIPTHDRPHLLQRAVKSALTAGTGVEVVVVDDGSIDETASVCKSITGIKYIRLEQNQGVAGARNVGISSSSAEYIAFLDDDDLRLPGSLDVQLAALQESSDIALVYGQALIDGARKETEQDRYPRNCPTGDVFWELLTENFIPSGAAVFRRSCLNDVGLLNKSIPGVDDWDLWIRISAVYRVKSVDHPVMIWRRPFPISDQGSARAVEMVALSSKQFKQCWLNLERVVEAPAHVRRRISLQFTESMARHLISEAQRSLSYGNVSRAHRCIIAALRHHPRGTAFHAAHEISSKIRRMRGRPSHLVTQLL